MGQCVADFSSASTICNKDTSYFTFTGNGKHFQWNFNNPASGAKNIDTLSNPKHFFTSPGIYKVQLIVSDSACADTIIKQVIVLQNPQISFSFINNCKNLLSTFTSTFDLDSLDTIKQIYWYADNALIDSGTTLSYSFNDTGTTIINATLTTINGCRDSAIKSISIFPLPEITSDKATTCIEQDIQYSLQSGSVPGIVFKWNFGDGSSSSQSAPTYQYATQGLYPVSLLITYPDSSTCYTTMDSIKISGKPNTNFRLLSDSVQCFTNNQFCFEFDGREKNLSYRTFIFGDGTQNNTFSLSDTSICYTYSDTAGGIYTVSYQAIDSNGCENSSTLDSLITIHPIVRANFIADRFEGCFATPVNFTNKSNYTPPSITKFKWDFGDGNLDSTQWNVAHTYTFNGTFSVTLGIESDLGCHADTTFVNLVNNINFDIDAKLDSLSSYCRSDNRLYYSQTPILGGDIRWYWTDGDTSYTWNTSKHYYNPGTYYPRVRVNVGGCIKDTVYDTVTIVGPRAIGNNIINRYQCQIKDTVYFTNASLYDFNQSRMTFWDFGDIYAPACTTNLALGINVGMNCRYSTDSILTQHFYSPGKEQCYFAKLVVQDTVLGCADSTYISLPLMPPKADIDLTALPPRAGMTLNKVRTCLSYGDDKSNAVVLNLSQTQPSCGRQRWWVMWDSLNAAQSGSFNSFWESYADSHFYTFANRPADSNGFITIGLIIENGRDSSNNVCRDTAWYHHFIQFEMFDPEFVSDYDSTLQYCAGSTFTFRFKDTLQQAIDKVEWYWGDGQHDTLVGNNTTLPIQHQFKTSGIYDITAVVHTDSGCSTSFSKRIKVGFYTFFEIGDVITGNKVCTNLPTPLLPQVSYFNNPTMYWNDSNRIKAGKEKIFWDMGDGAGFRDLGLPPFSFQYTKGGVYNVAIAVEDSVGCKDTFSMNNAVRVKYIQAAIETDFDSFVCAQSIQFKSLVSRFDSTISFPQDTSGNITYKWDFGNTLPTNLLPNPLMLMKEGSYPVTLVATNDLGCADTAFKSITVLGPKAHYNFTFDSIGCQPLYVEFTNNSTGATNYIWRYKDSSGNVFNTSSAANVSFTYNQFGQYFPTLTAQGTYVRNGVTITCSNTFPDSIPAPFRQITVLETPKVNFKHVTNCFTSNTQFTNTTYIGTSTISSVLWDFGDGYTSGDNDPLHHYNDTGRYVVTLTIHTLNGCSDSIKRMIVISPTPVPDFTFTNECAGVPIVFKDSSKAFNDVIVKWDWNFGDSTYGNFDIENKKFNKGGSYNVKLIITNLAGCSDSVSKTVIVHHKPSVQYNVGHRCSRQDLLISNLSSVPDTGLSYAWNLAGVATSTDFEPLHSFALQGTFNIKLKATSDFGCTDSITKGIVINPTPVPNFTPNNATQCFNEQLFAFTNTTSIQSGTFASQWKFGDGNSSALTSPTHTYADTGTYPITLITTSAFGCADTTTQSIKVQSNPFALFSIDDNQQCYLGNKFTFIDNTFGTQARTWLIKGNNFTDSVLQYSFADTGVHTVRMIAQSSNSCTDTIYKTVEVLPMPIAKIGVNIPAQCVNNQNFAFTDLTTLAKYPTWTSDWEFGNGKTSSSKTPTTTFDSAGFYTTTLRVMSSLGCADTVTYTIEVYPKPVPAFTVNDDEQCQINNLFIFSNHSSVGKGILTYKWNFGDGQNSIVANPNNTYTISGKPKVQLIATSSLGCVDSISKVVTVRAKPTASIAVNNDKQCINPNLFKFTCNGTSNEGTFVSFEWNIPTQAVNSLQSIDSFDYSFATHGTFPIFLYATTNYGCADSVQRPVVVHPKPKASFAINDSVQCINNQLFSFTNLSTIPYGTLNYQWTFGDGKGTVVTHPTHTYTIADTFQIRLLAISEHACKDTIEVPVIVHPKPFVDFNINDSGQCLTGNLYELQNISTIPYGYLTHYWDLGNGEYAISKDTQISYAAYGTYKILLRSTSNFGCIDTASHTVKVYPKPAPDFSINTEKQCLNENQYKFTTLSNIAYGTLTYSWDFGDGATDNNDSAYHRYTAIGSYDVKMITTSNFGCVDSSIKPIRIWANPTSVFAANNPAQCINTQNFRFINQSIISEGNIIAQQWNFGNGNFDTSKNTAQHYGSSGKYRISLLSYSDSGCLDSTINFVDIYPKPKANFDINDTSQCLYTNLFVFTDKSTDTLNLISYRWLIGNDSTATSKNTAYKFNTIGYHTIEHQIISELGCGDTAIRTIYVKPMPDPGFEKLALYYCNNKDSVSFIPTTPGGTFYGKNIINNLYMPQILWRDTVEYKVVVDGCLDSSSQITQVYPAPSVFLGSDTMLCKYEMLEFDVSFWNSTYEWQDRNKEAKYLVKRPGLYKVTVTNFCGSATDSVYIEYSENNCRLYLPTAFSPNKDGLNDYYKPITYDVENYHIQIFNRWGQIVYDGTQNDPGWDGTYMGMPCELGIYLVQVSYSYKFKDKHRNLTESAPLYLLK